MKVHLISDKISYLLLEQNNAIFKNKQSKKNIPSEMEDSQLDIIINELKKTENMQYIIDATGIRLRLNNLQSEFFLKDRFVILGIKEDVYNVLCDKAYEAGKKIFSRTYKLTTDDTNYIIWFNENQTNILWKYINERIIGMLDSDKDAEPVDLMFVRYIIADLLKKDIQNKILEKKTYLESSNVYVSSYLDIKCLFLETKVFDLIIIKMQEIIKNTYLSKKSIDERKNIYLLGVSNNGNILSRILAYVMDMNCESINHLGPSYCIESNIKNIERFQHKQYILVSDVLCLGGEYRMAKGILSMMNSELLGAVSIIKVRDVYRNKKKESNRAVAVLENIEQYGIDYKIYIDDKEE